MQGVHWFAFVAPSFGPYVPAVQGLHDVCAAFVNVPAGHTVHLKIGGSSVSDTEARKCPLGQEPPWHSVPCKGLFLGVHDPVKGATEQGLELQVAGLMYWSTPCLLSPVTHASLPSSYP